MKFSDQTGLSLRKTRVCYGLKASYVAFGVSWTKPSRNLPEQEQSSRNRGAIPPQTRFFHRFPLHENFSTKLPFVTAPPAIIAAD